MSQLPIEAVMPELLSGLACANQLILKAPPGAGKSTHFPLHLLKKNLCQGKIIMLEPRRLAARNIAEYLARQLNEKVGEQVGFRVRGETRVSQRTQLEIVTEGVLNRMLQSDPELKGIDILIFDEFHERSIYADTSLAFALEVQEALRDDLRIVVMSATLEQSALQQLLPHARYVESQGRSYPIEYRYSPLRKNERLVPMMAAAIKKALITETGSILAFLPSSATIGQLESELTELSSDVVVYPLFGRLSFEQQERAISPCELGVRKVVLATNIAETSLTIEGIRIVIDSGLERIAKFDLKTGITRLEESRIGQSSAAQRAGRAGRLESGVCIRLYSEAQLQKQPQTPEAEILHTDLAPLCLDLVQWGATEVDSLRWIDTPPQANLNQGYGLLKSLGLISSDRQMTSLGKQACQLGIEPRLAAMLLKINANHSHLMDTALGLIPLLEDPKPLWIDLSRTLTLLKEGKYKQQHAIKRATNLGNKVGWSFNLSKIQEECAGLCLAMAFPDRVGQRRTGQHGQFILANGHGASIDATEPLAASEYIVAGSLLRTNQDSSRIFLASGVDIHALDKLFPSLFESVDRVDWDERRGSLIAERRYMLGKIIVNKVSLPAPSREKITQALLNYISRKGLARLHWDERSLSTLERLRCGAQWLEELNWPDFGESALLENLDKWLMPFMLNVSTLNELSKIDLSEALLAYLGWPLNQQIDQLLPTHYQLPTGRSKAITYQSGAEPIMSVRMQEMFGESASPRIAEGRKTVVLELLSPAQRPLQITSDLAGFWAGSYKEVQKEMKGRYPKHPWPDDPANHVATTKTKRQLS